MGGSESEDHGPPAALTITIQPGADADVLEAYWWYETQDAGLGSEFLRAFEACTANLARHPTAYPEVGEEVRRALLRRFPYAVFYLVEAEAIVVLACLHTHRDPNEWRKRV